MEGFNRSSEEVVPITTSGGNENSEFSSSDEHEIHHSSSSQRVPHTRHTPHQIEVLEKFFKKNDHPSEEERIEIGRELNIEEKKVRYWFQNRRSQLKARKERNEGNTMKKENEKLKLEILALKEVVKNPICRTCGAQATIPDVYIEYHKLKMENERLKEKISRGMGLFDKRIGTPSPLASDPFPNKMTIVDDTTNKELADFLASILTGLELAEGSCNNNITYSVEKQSQTGINIDIRRNGYLEQASSAMEELLKLGLVNAPLWNRNKEGGGETLDFNEYVKAFPPRLGAKPFGFVYEGTRASSVVPMCSSTLVEALLNADRWREMFTGVIGSCTTTEVISKGLGGSRNGALQLMKAEIQLISPLVPVRVLQFIRFVKKQAEGLWTVVDVSYGMEGHQTRKYPSGCILQDMPNGLSKVTWIEHVEYDEQSVSHQYRKLISSGLGFGAQKWISALVRYCEGLKATTSPTLNTHLLEGTKINLKCLAQRMTSIFCAGVCLTGGQEWDLVTDTPGRPRIMARKCVNGFGEPLGQITSATYSVWIPTSHQHLFGLLLREDLRCMWDLICHKIATSNMIHFPLSQDKTGTNCISILNSSTQIEDNQIMVLQETSSDMTGSLIVYATMDSQTVSLVMYGKDTSSVALLPSGLCIVPGYGEGGIGAPDGERGSMVTVGFQVLQATTSHTMETINTLNDLVSRTVLGLKEIVRQ